MVVSRLLLDQKVGHSRMLGGSDTAVRRNRLFRPHLKRVQLIAAPLRVIAAPLHPSDVAVTLSKSSVRRRSLISHRQKNQTNSIHRLGTDMQSLGI
jgi:hypothetical protein